MKKGVGRLRPDALEETFPGIEKGGNHESTSRVAHSTKVAHMSQHTAPSISFQAPPTKNTRAYRLKELKRLVSFWKEHGVCMTLELEKAVFRVALPCLVHLRARP